MFFPGSERLASMHKQQQPLSYAATLERELREQDGRATVSFRGLKLASAFQPILSLAHHRTVGHEALLRAQDSTGAGVSPLTVFHDVKAGADAVYLDRLVRSLHTRNYTRSAVDNGWLFLNISSDVVVSGPSFGAFFAEMLERAGINPNRIVVEILEGAIESNQRLEEAVEFYHRLGCLVAIDDFGAGHSNFDRIWALKPDIVKLDRSIVVGGPGKTRHPPPPRRVLPSLVSLLHEAACLVLMEGVETREEALIAIDSDVDLVQGYFFARPAPEIKTSFCEVDGDLCADFRLKAENNESRRRVFIDPYHVMLGQSAARLSVGGEMAGSCSTLLNRPHILRCYLLNGRGRQVGSNLIPQHCNATRNARYLPLADTAGGNWYRRPYVRRALAKPGRVQTTRPYLSATDVTMCITISVAFEIQGEIFILCCDIDWETVEKNL